MTKKTLELRELAAGNTYALQVKAVSEGGQFISSGYSLTLNFTTDKDTIAPNPPSALDVVVEGSNFVATWNPPTSNTDGSEIQDFKDFKVTVTDVVGGQSVVYYTTGNRFEFTEEMNRSAFGDFSQGIADMPDKLRGQIQIGVISRDFAQNESSEVTDSATNPAPGPVTLTDVTDNKPLTASIDWGQPTGNDILAYRVRRGTATGVYDVNKVVYNTEYSTGGLSRGTYYFRVDAYDKFGNVTSSNEVTSQVVGFWESEQAVPDEPTISNVDSTFDISTQTSDLTFDVTGPATADGGTITDYDFHSHYEVRWGTNAAGPFQYQTIEEEDNTATHSVAINGLKPATTYYYGVKSVSQYGRSGGYETGSLATDVDSTPPAAPANPSAQGSLKNITAQWDANTEPDLDYYVLYASQTSGFTPDAGTNKIYQGNGTGFAHSVNDAETWYFKVTATDKSGNTSAVSAQFSATSSNPVDEADTEPPSNVTGLAGTADTYYHGSSERAYVDLTWNAATDNVGVTDYIIAYRESGGTWTELIGSGDSTAYRVGDLQPGVTYNFRLKAADAEGNRSSAWSATINRTPTSDSTAIPSNVTLSSVVSNSPGTLTADWVAVTNVPVRYYIAQVDDNAGFTSPTEFRSDGTRLDLSAVPAAAQHVRVKAVDEFGQQSAAWSNALNTTVKLVKSTDLDSVLATSVSDKLNMNFDTFDISDWHVADGAGAATVVTGADYTGGSALHVDGTQWLTYQENLIPFDPEKIYKMTIRVKETVASSGDFYAGLAGWAADGVTKVNRQGLDTHSNQHYNVASNLDLPFDTWVTYVGYVKGHAAQGEGGSGFNTPDNSAKMHEDVRFISPLYIVDLNSGAGETIIDFIKVEALDLITDRNFEDGSITSLVKFGGDLRPPSSVSSLPALPDAQYPDGALVYLTTDNKLYRNENGTWSKAVPTTDLDGTIVENQIADAAVTLNKVAANAVNASKIVDSSIVEAKLNDAAVTLNKIAANAVNSSKIVNNAITEQKLNDAAVTLNKIAANAVDTTKILNDAITSLKIANAAVSEAKIATDAVTATKIANAAVIESKLNDAAVTLNKIAANAVDTTKLTDSAVTEDKLNDAAVTLNKVAANAIDTTKILNDAITTLKIANDAISEAKIQNDAITSQKIIDNAVTGDKFGAVVRDEILSKTFALKKNFISYASANEGEVFVHGFDNDGQPANVDGFLYYEGTKYTLPRSIAPTMKASQEGWVMWSLIDDLATRLPTPSGSYKYRFVFMEDGLWYYDDNSGSTVQFTPTSDDILIGYCRTGAIDSVDASYAYAVPLDLNDAVVSASKVSADSISANSIQAEAITTTKLAANAVIAEKIAANSVVAGKIAANAVDTDQLVANAITTAKIAADAVNADKIAANTITATEIAANAITASELAADSVVAGKIAADAVDTAQLTANAVTAAKIAANTITASEIAANAITASELAANSVIAGKIAANAVDTDQLTANAVTAAKIAADTITASEIAAGAITASELAAASVVAGKIAADAVTATEIAANTITAGEIAANAITASELAANSVIAAKIQAGAVETDKLDANAVTAAKIAANTITAGEIAANAITASELAADSVIAGKIAANAVDTNQLTANAVTAAKIAANTITASEIAALTITAGQLAADSVIAGKVAANAIDTAQLTANAITADKIDTDAVTANKIQAGAVVAAKIATDAVTADKIEANAVTANKLNVVVGGGNLLKNSSFEKGEYGGSIVSSALDTSVYRSGYGVTSWRWDGDGGPDNGYSVPFAIQPGEVVTATAYAMRTSGTTARTRLRFSPRDNVGGVIANDYGDYVSLSDTDWTRLFHTYTMPAGTVTCYVYLQAESIPVGESIWWDDVQAEIGDVATSYAPKTDEILPGTIVGNMIQAGSITAADAVFDTAAIQSADVGVLTADKITLGSASNYDSGYDPTTKETPAGAQTKADAARDTAIDYAEKEIVKDAVAPGSPDTGDLWLETDTTPQQLYRWDGSAWIAVGATSATDIGSEPARFEGTSAPADTTVLWVDTTTVPNVLKRYNGSSWEKMTPTTAAEVGTYDSSTIDSKDTTVQNAAATDATNKANQAEADAIAAANSAATAADTAIDEALRGDFTGSTTGTQITAVGIATGEIKADLIETNIAIANGLRVQSLFELNNAGIIRTDTFLAGTRGFRLDKDSLEIYGSGDADDVSLIVGGENGLNMNSATSELWFGGTSGQTGTAALFLDGSGKMRVGSNASNPIYINGSTGNIYGGASDFVGTGADWSLLGNGQATFSKVTITSAGLADGTDLLNVGGGSFILERTTSTTATMTMNGTFNLAGTQNVTGSINVNGGDITVTTGDIINNGGTIKSGNYPAATSYALLSDGTLDASGATISGTLDVTGPSSFGSTITVDGTMASATQTADVAGWTITNTGSATFFDLAIEGGSFSATDGLGNTVDIAGGVITAVGADIQGAIKADDGYLNNMDITGLLTATGTSGRVEIDTAGVRLYDAVTGGNLNVDLNTSTGNATFKGNITATGGTITGLLKATGTGGRVEIDTAGVRLYNAPTGGTVKVNLNTTTGNATFTGDITATGGSITGVLDISGGELRSIYSDTGEDYLVELDDEGRITFGIDIEQDGTFVGNGGIYSINDIFGSTIINRGIRITSNTGQFRTTAILPDDPYMDVTEDYIRLGYRNGSIHDNILIDQYGIDIDGAGLPVVISGSETLFTGDIRISDNPANIAFNNSGASWRYWLHQDSGDRFYLLTNQGSGSTWSQPYPWWVDGGDQTVHFDWQINAAGQDVSTGTLTAGAINASSINTTGSVSTFGASEVDTYIRFGNAANQLFHDVSLSRIYTEINNSLITLAAAGGFYPGTDSVKDLGNGTFAWKQVTAVDTTINASDARMKEDVNDTSLGLGFLNLLRPVEYKWIGKTRPHQGLIAQELKATIEDLGIDFAGFIDPTVNPSEDELAELEKRGQTVEDMKYGIRYAEFIGPLIKAAQELSAKNEELEARIAALEAAS